ncbi:MAG: alpha/beta hydrolase [Caulobacteraceae bacterium]|nr:alpha/beta hydrolase [Caulobacteraceae bacterium]
MPTSVLSACQSFTLASKGTGRDYMVSLGRPLVGLDGELPIFIVLDSGITFGSAVESAAMRMAMGALEPAVIVGVGYDTDIAQVMRLRTADLTPPAPADKYPEMAAMMGTEYGGADAFLEFLLGELVPAIRERAPEASANRRILYGHSLGGLFAAHALLTRPESFETFCVSSPSLWWNDFAILSRFETFAETLKARQAQPRVLVSIAAGEQDPPTVVPPWLTLEAARERVAQARMVDAAREFAGALEAFDLPELAFAYFHDESHDSVIQAAVARAVTFGLKRRG